MRDKNPHRVSNRLPRRVDFFDNSQDFECAFLGSMGFSTRCIMRQTKLGPGQITYRLKKASIRRLDYRDGTSEYATMVMRGMRDTLEREVTKHLRDTLL